jgi:hypothetical protein
MHTGFLPNIIAYHHRSKRHGAIARCTSHVAFRAPYLSRADGNIIYGCGSRLWRNRWWWWWWWWWLTRWHGRNRTGRALVADIIQIRLDRVWFDSARSCGIKPWWYEARARCVYRVYSWFGSIVSWWMPWKTCWKWLEPMKNSTFVDD